ncbi:MAG: ABC transporter ATP-binding protein [Lachnospiraceae bacterium]|nr:ABC transporter ATP-binding protein [Lachnospiraceae bacterium]
MSKNLVEVKGLKKYFSLGEGNVLKAVDDVSFTIREGETFGLVGESGCGKTTVGRTITRLYAATGGQILFDGKDVTHLNKKDAKALAKDMQMIFQDPYASLDPRMTVEMIISEGMKIHKMYSEEETGQKVYELLELVGLNKEHATRYPHEFSGGQRQRVGIARALAVNPRFIVCDEPISALDVSVQAQVVNLLKKLQKEKHLSYLFIAHDLSLVKYLSDRIGVMYMGSLVEVAEAEELYQNPLHPYTRALLSAIPVADPKEENERQRLVLEGEPSNPINTQAECKFYSRCPHRAECCRVGLPALREVKKGHFLACSNADALYVDNQGFL